MNLLQDEELNLLRDSAQRLMQERSAVSALRRLRDQRDKVGYDVTLWQEMVELGWAGLITPQEYGGVGFGHRGLCVVMEALGQTLCASPLLSTAVLGVSVINYLGHEKQKQALLEAIASGKLTTALALEEGNRHSPFSIETSATPDTNGFLLNGSKRFVLDGHVADKLIVVARLSGTSNERDGLSLFLVDCAASGVTVSRTWMVDSRNAANIELRDVRVDAEAVLGGPDAFGRAADGLDRALDVGRVALAAEMLGASREAFSRIVDYLKLREQFGVKIGSFQALKHRAAVMFTEIELAISAVRAGASALDESHPETPLFASLAKAKVNDVMHLVSSEGIQMFGGIGMTDDEEIGLFLKRARVAEQTLGDSRFHRDRYASLSGY